MSNSISTTSYYIHSIAYNAKQMRAGTSPLRSAAAKVAWLRPLPKRGRTPPPPLVVGRRAGAVIELNLGERASLPLVEDQGELVVQEALFINLPISYLHARLF